MSGLILEILLLVWNNIKQTQQGRLCSMNLKLTVASHQRTASLQKKKQIVNVTKMIHNYLKRKQENVIQTIQKASKKEKKMKKVMMIKLLHLQLRSMIKDKAIITLHLQIIDNQVMIYVLLCIKHFIEYQRVLKQRTKQN